MPQAATSKSKAKSKTGGNGKAAIKRAPAAAAKPAAKAAKTAKPKAYQPAEDEKYMSARQIKYFHNLFAGMKKNIENNTDSLITALQTEVNVISDENDRASKESEFAVELRERERELRLMSKIDLALRRIDKKEFGFCEECGDKIGIKRLLARPVATLCFECKNLQEEYEKTGGASPFNAG